MRLDIVTAGRSDYGIYRPVLQELSNATEWDVRLIVSGSHLHNASGVSLDNIKSDGFLIEAEIPLEDPQDSQFEASVRMALQMGRATQGLAKAYAEQRPDLVLILGDRYEMFALASACVPMNIPLAHIHGGELSLGAIDDVFRHALTKMSHLHFASTREYGNRILQMGEEHWRVTISGAPGLDALRTFNLPSRAHLEEHFSLDLQTPPILVTYHAETRTGTSPISQLKILLAELSMQPHPIVFTAPNMDGDYDALRKILEQYVAAHANAYFVENFGLTNYLAMLRESKAVVGNSSSGLIETPLFGLPVLNIGKRQDGRVRGKNVIDVPCEPMALKKGLDKALSDSFSSSLKGMLNPYGDGYASQRIVERLQKVKIDSNLLNKHFHDQP